MLRARDLRISAQKRNLSKVTKRAKQELARITQERLELLNNVGELTTQLKQQGIARECKSRQHWSILDRYQQSKTHWKRRACAAEESRRYMLAKARKMAVPKRLLKTTHAGAYKNRI